jgi:ring-1,2-phenylacetyl-CoA epoxidase subunit PaaC
MRPTSIEPAGLNDFLLALADDQLILGHRDSEWCGNAPILEEDIAFANLALDEIGHAGLWYGLLAELDQQDPVIYPDRLVYFRDAGGYRNVQMVELPIGDWAFSTLRQYLYDVYELVMLEALEKSGIKYLAGIAQKIRTEELYHLRHTCAWVRRLGLGTTKSHVRMQNALSELWPYTGQLFEPFGEQGLVENGYAPDWNQLKNAWKKQVFQILNDASLIVPELSADAMSRDRHTPHLQILLDEMQSVARLDARARW